MFGDPIIDVNSLLNNLYIYIVKIFIENTKSLKVNIKCHHRYSQNVPN